MLFEDEGRGDGGRGGGLLVPVLSVGVEFEVDKYKCGHTESKSLSELPLVRSSAGDVVSPQFSRLTVCLLIVYSSQCGL